jgi:hypothetical protein
VEYYRTPQGKYKKNLQNSKRSERATKLECDNQLGKAAGEVVPYRYRFDAGMLGYVRMVTSLIEGRRVSRDEILQMLDRAVRQHSMVRRRRIDYVLRYLQENDP